ncbi:MAG: FtsH protease activity modulator HflK [Candidatus Krumholzibacteria bacterium]
MAERGFGGGDFKIPNFKIPSASSGTARWIIGGIAVLILAISTFYTIGPEETGVVLRLGHYDRATDPGLHMKMPLGIEKVIKVPIERQLKEEFGFQTVSAGVRSQFSVRGRESEANMLTGDLNAAVVEWVVQYRIVDPYKFLFRVRNVRSTFRDMSEAVMRYVVGDRTVNEVLTIGRQEIADLVETELQGLCDQYETGIKVEQVVLQDVNPPDQVKPSFNEVNEAQQEREKLINEAQSEYNRVIPRARGQAQQAIQEARGYALERVNTARGDSARFVAVFDEYRKAPEITRKRIYLETMNTILPQVAKKIIVDDNLKSLIPLLNLEPGEKTKGGGN